VDARLDAEERARKEEEKTQREREREREREGEGHPLEGSQPGNKRAGESGAAGMRTGRRAVE